MIWRLLFFILSMYLYDWVGSIAILLALRVLHGASWALSTTAVSTTITDIIPISRRGEGMGWFGMAMTVAMAIGPMLGGFDLGIGLGAIILRWVSQYTGYEVLFIVCAVSVTVSAFVFMAFVRQRLSEKRIRTG
jgi:predicted MFS family arabinose efflux permease